MLSGIRVIDCTGPLGWFAGRMLADLGADVIRIESPGAARPDAAWRALNISKTIVSADSGQAARAEIERLAADADILLATPESRQNLDAEKLASLNPRLIVVAITPFGLDGPKAAWQGSDIEIMAASGAMSLAGEPDGPARSRGGYLFDFERAGFAAKNGALIVAGERGPQRAACVRKECGLPGVGKGDVERAEATVGFPGRGDQHIIDAVGQTGASQSQSLEPARDEEMILALNLGQEGTVQVRETCLAYLRRRTGDGHRNVLRLCRQAVQRIRFHNQDYLKANF